MSKSKEYTYTSVVKLPRVELSNKPTLIITEKLQRQIDFLHKKVGNNEWSGELITREEGVISDLGDWTVIAEDIFLCDIGSGAFTGYEVDKGGFKAPDVVEMYEQFPGLLDGTQKNHHIHSHHNMNTFFSGTDNEQLHDRSLVSNYFIMLIVNHKNEHIAKVAFKAKKQGERERILEFANNVDNIKPIRLSSIPDVESLVVMDMIVKWESISPNVEDKFSERYDLVKAALEAEKLVKTYKPGANVWTPGKGWHGGDHEQGEMFQDTKTESQDSMDHYHESFEKFKEKETKQTKRIQEMTSREWTEYNAQMGGGLKKFDIRDAKCFINALISDKTLVKDFSEPFVDLKKKNIALGNKIKDIRKWQDELTYRLQDTFDDLYPYCDTKDLKALLETCNTYLLSYKYQHLLVTELIEVFKGYIEIIEMANNKSVI